MATAPSNLPSIYSVVGQIAINWSAFELILDHCVFVLHVSCGGRALCPNIPKTSFTRKRDFVRACMIQLPALQPFASEFLPALENATALSKERNEKIHGAIFADEGQEENFRFISWNLKQTMPSIQQKEVSLNALLDLSERMSLLNQEMVRISAPLFLRFGR